MGILSCLFCTDINRGVREFQATPGAVLLDVRTAREHDFKRIPNSQNLPLADLDQAKDRFPDRDLPLYVYAYGGEASAKATRRLKAMGFTTVHDIGGIKKCCGSQGYKGPAEGTRWHAST